MKKNTIRIVFTGGSGRFGSVLKKIRTKYKVYFPSRNQLDIANFKRTENYIKKIKPKYLIHAAALSRPMDIHDKNIFWWTLKTPYSYFIFLTLFCIFIMRNKI